MKTLADITDQALAKAMTHPLRARILSALDGRTASPSELAGELGAPLGVTSYHVRRLESLGFLTLVERVPRRGVIEHYYTANARPQMTDGAWTATSRAVRRATAGAALDEVGRTVTAAAGRGGFDHGCARLAHVPVVLDAEGFEAMADELDRLLERLSQVEAESRRRLAASVGGGQPASVVVMLFDTDRAA